jgi:DNA-binding NarL/FixJ family response regulator
MITTIYIPNTNNLYSVNVIGEVFSYKFNKVKRLKQQTNSSGYKQVGIVLSDGSRKIYLVHRLVAQAFIPKYSEYLSVHHIDYNINNNILSNLKVMTYAENTQDAASKLKMNKKLTQEQVIYIKQELARGVPQVLLARQHNVSEATISYIKSETFWKHTKA